MVVWHLAKPLLAVSSAPLGGGLGLRSWVVNAEVAAAYARLDPDRHLEDLAAAAELTGSGVGMLTAAPVSDLSSATEDGVQVDATVGIEHPTWASGTDDLLDDRRPGTINVVAFVPERLSHAALVNAVVTVTEAKAQALLDAGVPGTGTASDAVCVLSMPEGIAERFCGPRSFWGARLARATYRAISAGCTGGAEGEASSVRDPAGPVRRRPGTTAS